MANRGCGVFSVSAAVALLAVQALAQPPLTQQSPSPTGVSLGGVAFTSPTHGFIVGDNHNLIETFDGGQTWITRMATGLSSDPFYTITFASPTHGYLAGNNQDAYRTVDGGVTWTQMPTMFGGSVRRLDFITPTHGFAGYNGAITATTDGGLTWSIRSVYPDGVITFGMDFRDANMGLIAGIRSTPHHDAGIYRTTNGGLTVTHVSDANTNAVLWISETSALAVGQDTCLRSDDEGVTWYEVGFGIDTGLAAIARAGNSSVICGVSTGGDIWKSPDLGVTWYKLVEGMGVLPADWAITMFDENTGYVAGANGLTFRTTDAGESWTLLNNGCGDTISDLKFFGESFGIAVTERGYVFRTTDGGLHWDVKILKVTGQVWGRSEGLDAISIIDQNNIVVAGLGGLCFRSYDGGNTWYSIGFPSALPSLPIEDVLFINDQVGYVTGFFDGDSNLYGTTDGGFTWNEIPGPMGSGVVVERKGDRIWVALASNVVDRSFNAGQTWTRTFVPGSSFAIQDMQFWDQNVGYAVGTYGNIIKTVNGGVSWTSLARSNLESYYSMTVLSATEVWVVGARGPNAPIFFHLHTTNGGATWTRTDVPLGYAEYLDRIHASPAGRIWLAGGFGRIMASAPTLPFRMNLPDDVPANVAANTPTDVLVRIVPGTQTIVPGSPTMWFRTSPSAAYQPIPLTNIDGEGDDYEAVLPGMGCSAQPQFYFSAQGSGGAQIFLPNNAPTAVLTTRVGTFDPAAPILDVGFESGLPAGWTATGLWHVTSACAPPAGTCGSGGRAYYGLDATCTFNTGATTAGSLISAPITLPSLLPGQHLTLKYCHGLDTQNAENGISDFDKAEVWVQHPAGQNPRDLPTDRGQPTVRTAPMDQYAGQTIRLEFRFNSVSAAANAFRGWHVDNVRIEGPALVCVDTCPADLDNGSGTGQSDGAVTIDDLLYFLVTFEAGSDGVDLDNGSGTGTPDGAVTVDDLLFMLVRFEEGC
jgi:photosystem II stability/assembly factor-like uncharacterized protein